MPQLKFVVAGSLILGAICYLMISGFSGSMVYYYTVPELLSQAAELEGRGIRVSGHVSPGSIERYYQESRVEFVVFDRETSKNVRVTFRGVVPDTFNDNAEVVVEGTFAGATNHFTATTLLAKCPSKYEAAESHPAEISLERPSE